MKSKRRFKEIINSIKVQHDADLEYAKQVGEALGVEVNPYNNHLIINCLIEEVGSWFLDRDNVIREVTRFIYDLDFGRCKGCELITLENLWDQIEDDIFDFDPPVPFNQL